MSYTPYNDSGFTIDENDESEFLKTGGARNVLRELKNSPTITTCTSCQSTEKLKRTLIEREEELKRLNVELMEMSAKLTIAQVQLSAIEEERNFLRESNSSNSSGRDELVKRAWEIRDQAIARKNSVEIDLAKTRIECFHVNSQLMEAIQQKIALSEQLEQWQNDMESLIDDRVRSKAKMLDFEDRRRRRPLNSTPVATPASPTINRRNLLRLWRSK